MKIAAAAAAAVIPLALLAGCAATLPQTPPAIDYPPLLPPATLGSSHTSQQILRAAFGDREATLRCVLVATPQHLKLVVLTATGQRALTLDWDGVHWKIDRAPMVPTQLDPQQLVADIELSMWPLQALREPWHAAGWDVSEPGGNLRRLRRGGHIFAEVHYADSDPWHGRFWLVNFRYGYSLGIETQPMS